MIANLTGHEITLVDRVGNVVQVIEPCAYEEPIRAEVGQRRMGRVEGIRVTKLFYTTNVSKAKMKELLQKYDGIVVSKISAEALKAQGFNKGIYITGRKFYLHGEFKGVKELSIL